jgi:hypothetical protein
LFSLLLITTQILVHIYTPANPQAEGDWLSSNAKSVNLALKPVPFAGIAFLWVIGVGVIALGRLKTISFPPCSWTVGSCYWPHYSFLLEWPVVSSADLESPRDRSSQSGIYTYGCIVVYEIMQVSIRLEEEKT